LLTETANDSNELEEFSNFGKAIPSDDEESHTPDKAFPCKSCITNFLWGIYYFLSSNYLNFFLAAIPFSILATLFPWGHIPSLLLSLLPLLPLSWQLFWIREQISRYCEDKENTTVVALLDFFFSNGTEVILGLFLLFYGSPHIAQSLVVGSILSKTILTMGLCFITHVKVSGDDPESIAFNHPINNILSSILITAVLALFIPGYFDFAKLGSKEGILRLSRWESIVLFLAGIVFSIFLARNWNQLYIGSGYEERSKLKLVTSIFVLIVVISLICFESNEVAKVIRTVALDWGLSDTFIGTILLPIVTQSATHISHIRHTLSDSLSVGVSNVFSNSINLAIYVAPLFVLFSWSVSSLSEDKPAMGLNFGFFHIITTLFSILSVKFVSMDGQVVWYTGVFMVFVYITLAIAFFYHT